MTVYLLDENVLRELHPRGDVHVRAWFATVADSDLRISAVTFFEKRRGAERLRRREPRSWWSHCAYMVPGALAAALRYGVSKGVLKVERWSERDEPRGKPA